MTNNFKKIIFSSPNSQIKIEDFMGEGIFYILPTEDALREKRESYIFKRGSLEGKTFLTFDSLVSNFIEVNKVDKIYEFYILKKVLRSYFPQEENFQDFSKVIFDFFEDIFLEGADPKSLLTFEDDFVKKLYEPLRDYISYFKEKNISLDGGYALAKNFTFPIKKLIIDGFIDFRKKELEIIKNISSYAETIIHMPFNILDFPYGEKTLKDLENLSFALQRADGLSVKDLLRYKDIKIISSSNAYNTMVFGTIKSSLKSFITKKIGIVLGGERGKNLLNVSRDLEGLEYSIDQNYKNFIGAELKIYMTYLLEKNKENILSRAGLHYIAPLESISQNLLKYLDRERFSKLSDLKINQGSKIYMDEKEIGPYINLIENLRTEDIEKTSDISYYTSYFRRLLEGAGEILEDDYKNFREIHTYREGRMALDEGENFLDLIENFKNLYESISLKEFVEIFSLYLDQSSIMDLNNFEGIRVFEIERGFYRDFDNLIFLDYDSNYSSGPKINFIYERSNFKDLKNMGLIKEFSQLKAIKLIYSLCMAKKSLFLINNREKGLANILALIKSKAGLKIFDYEDKFITSRANENVNLKKEDSGILQEETVKTLRSLLENRSYSATDFDAYVACGRKFLLERIFKIEDFYESLEAIEAMEKGSIYHKILKEYFSKRKDYDEEFLNSLIILYDFSMDKKFEDLSFEEKLEFSIDFKRLSRLIKNNLENLQDFKAAYFEKRFKFFKAPFTLVGSIDRIDENNEGEILIDYKSSSASSKSQREILEGESFQFPIYIMARKDKGKNFAKASYEIIKTGESKAVLINKDIIEKNDSKRCYYSNEEIDKVLNNSFEKMKEVYEAMLEGEFSRGKDCK